MYLPKVSAAEDCYTFEVLEAELEFLLFPRERGGERTQCSAEDNIRARTNTSPYSHA